MNLLNKLERSLFKFRIAPFFQYIVFMMAGVFIFDLFFPNLNLLSNLMLVRPLLAHGEFWRVFTFLVVPPISNNILSVALALYFYYFVGTSLESRWGARRFLLYYAVGAIAAIIAGLVSGIGTNMYLNLSLFFAFAIQYPDYQLLLFFVLPIKMKWLALASFVFFIFNLFTGTWSTKVAILFSLAHIILFFGGDLYNLITRNIQQWRRRQVFKKNSRK